MFLSDRRGQPVSHDYQKAVACVGQTSDAQHAGPDNQLMADCQSFTSQMRALLKGIEKAAKVRDDEQGHKQASLCEAEEQALDVMDRITATRALTECGVQSKHAVADLLLAIGWYAEPSPCRDALLLSCLRDAALLRYPAETGEGSARVDLDATTTIIDHSEACLAVIQDLVAGFRQKDRDTELDRADQDDLDRRLLTLRRQKNTAIIALIRMPALSAPAIHAKRLVLKHMLETGDSDGHHLRVELAQSYLSDLNTFLRANSQGRETLWGHGWIWNNLSSKFRWLTSTVQHR
jgi:hypothetical protein